MKNNCNEIGSDKMRLTSERWNMLVDECFNCFFLAEAHKKAAQQSLPKLSNTLLLVRNFSTVVKAKQSMKAGDIGRLMLIWKRWCFMCQAIKGITNYSTYLPRMVLLLTKIMPPSMQKYLRHNLLICPSGCKNHFVAKDFWHEVQNY